MQASTNYTTGTGQKMQVHNGALCRGRPCVIHHPSDHSMRQFKTHWRDDRKLMERICSHGVGHPDPDDQRYLATVGRADGVHGCDGCCDPSKVWDMLLNELHPGDKIIYPTTRASSPVLVVAQITNFLWRKDRDGYNGKEDCAPDDPAAELSLILTRLQTSENDRVDPSRPIHYKTPERCVRIGP